MSIRDRILARRDLDAMREMRDITGLAYALNDECVEAMVPVQVNLASILAGSSHQEVLVKMVQDAADGHDVKDVCEALLSETGVEVLEPGFIPPLTDQLEVANAMWDRFGNPL